ncbi:MULTISPECIES: SelL-related redox protein [unclassified Aureispira]|uniref:SelL-related redox protein n=1 Tax=unclassified Aureispira TaxID=2649989 RepID=UPI0006968102|nr:MULTISPECIES: SelL-related redox protein [unclassified Aureispira]WMX13786.1 SelL-related redox protein [Aureispira sp. CCB-E]
MNLELEILEAIFTNEGNDLRTITEENTVMLVFLRHFGCVFCREALNDFANIKDELDRLNIKLVFVHMAEEIYGEQYLKEYNLESEEHVSDPDMTLYEYFGLQKGTFSELYGLKVWSRAIGLKFGFETKKPLGNMKQMPGVFLLKEGKIINSFIHKSASDQPDYLAMTKLLRSDASQSN